jgi:RNA polymerase sigma-70 factor (ECF subfamily)
MTPDELEARLAALHDDSFGWACACCGWDETEAEDVLQTTYVKVISGRARFENRSSFRTWLFGVIRFTARERLRARTRHHRAQERVAGEAVAMGQPPRPPDADVEEGQRAAILRAALGELSGRQQEVLNLVFYQGMSIREAGEVMGVSLGSARVHYERGKQRLRALLGTFERGRERL